MPRAAAGPMQPPMPPPQRAQCSDAGPMPKMAAPVGSGPLPPPPKATATSRPSDPAPGYDPRYDHPQARCKARGGSGGKLGTPTERRQHFFNLAVENAARRQRETEQSNPWATWTGTGGSDAAAEAKVRPAGGGSVAPADTASAAAACGSEAPAETASAAAAGGSVAPEAPAMLKAVVAGFFWLVAQVWSGAAFGISTCWWHN